MTSLDSYLSQRTSPDIASAISALAGAAARISAEIRAPRVTLDAVAGQVNADGDTQKALDVLADDAPSDALWAEKVVLRVGDDQGDPTDFSAIRKDDYATVVGMLLSFLFVRLVDRFPFKGTRQA